MEKKFVVPLKDAVTGSMQSGGGTYRILIDEERNGAKNLKLFRNTLSAGTISSEHKHEEESCWYILSGRGTMRVQGESFEIGPDMAVFAPAEVLHQLEAGPEEDLTYLMVNAPPGLERQIRQQAESGSESH